MVARKFDRARLAWRAASRARSAAARSAMLLRKALCQAEMVRPALVAIPMTTTAMIARFIATPAASPGVKMRAVIAIISASIGAAKPQNTRCDSAPTPIAMASRVAICMP